MTQNPEQFVQDPWGSVVAANAAIKILKTQDATSAAAVAERFHLTRSEQQRLITLGKQEALVLAGEKRVVMTIEASPEEHDLITTNPVERAGQAPYAPARAGLAHTVRNLRNEPQTSGMVPGEQTGDENATDEATFKQVNGATETLVVQRQKGKGNGSHEDPRNT